MSLAPQLAAAAMSEPSPVHTPLMELPARVPPLKAPKRKSTHAIRVPVEPRRLESDTWSNDATRSALARGTRHSHSARLKE